MNKYRLSIDMILENKINFILSFVLTGIGFFLIGFTLLVYLAGNYGKDSAENVLSQGIEQTGVLNFHDVLDFASENGRKFRKGAFDSEFIHSIGTVERIEFENKDFPELYEVQSRDNLKKGILNTDVIQMLRADLEVFHIAEMALERGVGAQDLDYTDDHKVYLYLGYAYRDISIGTQFVIEADDGEETVYEVAGILRQGETFVSMNLLSRIDFTTIRNDVNMDEEIMCINDGYSSSAPWFFSVDRKFSMEQGMSELEKIAEKYEIEVEMYPLREMFDVVEAETAIMQDSLFEMLLCLVVVILGVVITLQIVQIYQSSHQYGILSAIGFSTADMQCMIIIRNVIYFILSVCFGIILLLFSGQKYFITNEQVKELFYHILFYKVLPVDLVLMLILLFVVSFVPCRMFHRMEPVSMLQSR